MVAFITASLVPLIIAAAMTIPWFRNATRSEAQRSLDTHARVATGIFEEKTSSTKSQIQSIADSFSDPELRTAKNLPRELERQTDLLGLDYMMWVDVDGVVRGSTTGQLGHRLDWPDLATAVESGDATGFASIAPITELTSLDMDEELDLRVKETKGGTAQQSEAAGALSIVGVAPVTDSRGRKLGSVVGVSTLKLDNDFVDSVTDKVGGVATVFQNGVRVATTVRDDTGERAVGTVVSDQVRAAVLGQGAPYRGEAFVVNKQYLTAYEPITDPNGAVIGMLFVGIDEAPYNRSALQFSLAMVGLVALGAVVSAGVAWFSSAGLAAPIRRVSQAAERIAAGDLTAQVEERGLTTYTEAESMAAAFTSMTSGLRSFIRDVANTAGRLDNVSTGIQEASAVEAESASSQASAVTEATATIEELDRSFAAVAEGARRVLDIAENSLEVADGGREAVQDGQAVLERLADGAASVREASESLSEVANDIGQVTFVIGSIAEQTKILALNAAIEAARAGAAGKGFAVVATEIRTLADSVSTSIIRIEDLVRNIQDASKVLSETARLQAQLGEESVSEGRRTRDSFDEIYGRMDRTAAAAREIATAAAQQQAAARQIVTVMHQVSSGVTATAAAARQLADSSNEVKREASSLSMGLKGYRVD